jgi:hypothetical protein
MTSHSCKVCQNSPHGNSHYAPLLQWGKACVHCCKPQQSPLAAMQQTLPSHMSLPPILQHACRFHSPTGCPQPDSLFAAPLGVMMAAAPSRALELLVPAKSREVIIALLCVHGLRHPALEGLCLFLSSCKLACFCTFHYLAELLNAI